MLEKIFHLKENHTDVKTELMAGVTTFMTMAYILAVNPSILSASGMDANAVLIATSLASFVGTALMALLANYPFALAPGMGLNAYFSYTVVLTMGYSWQLALMAVFVEGVIFIVLSLTNVREAIFNAIPMTLKSAVSVGIGLFIGAGSAMLPWAFGGRIFQSFDIHLSIPALTAVETPWGVVNLFGDLHLVSSTVFDVGVYLVVLGVTLAILLSISNFRKSSS